MSTTAMLMIGASSESIEAYKESILAIMNTTRGDDVVKHALTALNRGVQVKNTSVNGCTFQTGIQFDEEE